MIQQLINGLSLGSIYALIALGYTMIYGILRFINFAHGDVFMLGAFFGYYISRVIMPLMGVHTLLGSAITIVLAMAAGALTGVVIEKLAYKPIRTRPKLTMLITAIGVSLLLEFGGQHVFGPDPKVYPELIPNFPVINTPTVVLGSAPIIVIIVALVLMVALRFIVYHTRIGIAMRAVSNHQNAASLMGINIGRVISFTFALGSALATAAGILYASVYPSINPLMGVFPGLKAFIAAVLGGIGSIPGAVLGGFLIGLIETLVTGYLSPTYRDAIAFGILIIILLVRPAGLLAGKFEQEKV